MVVKRWLTFFLKRFYKLPANRRANAAQSRRRARLAVEVLEDRLTPAGFYLQSALTDPNGAANDHFGSAVAISNGYVLVGAYGTNQSQGAAYLYDASGQLLQTFTDPNLASGDQFGFSVALFGTDVLVGAPGVNTGVFGSTWTEGAAYLYDVSGKLLQTFTEPNVIEAGDEFGCSVALPAGDVLVGADETSDGGGAYLFSFNDQNLGSFGPFDSPIEGYASSLAYSADGILVGANGYNVAYLGTTSGVGTQIADPLSGTNNEFGESVGLSGSNYIIGAPGYGQSEGAVDLKGVPITDPNSRASDNFGYSVAISGSDALVGADGASSSDGAAYLYNLSGQQIQTLTDPSAKSGDDFGSAVALSGSNAVVAADGANGSQGAVYIYGTAPEVSDLFGDNQNTTVGTTFSTALETQVTDASGNPVQGASVTFTETNGSAGAGAAFAGGVTVTVTTNAEGMAIAPLLTANMKAGTFTVTASMDTLSTTFDLANVAGVPASVSTFAGTPQSTEETTVFDTPLQAVVKDSDGNPVSGVSVEFLLNSSNGSTGTFPGGASVATAVTNASGVATAPALTADDTPGSFTAGAFVNGLTESVFSLTITAPASYLSALFGNNQSTTVGTPFATQLEALMTDLSLNPVLGGTVDFQVTDGPNGAGATFTGSSSANAGTDTQGQAVAPPLTANSIAGTFTVAATDAFDVFSTTTFTLTNLAGAAASISTFAGTPQSAPVGTTFSTPLQALVKDSDGNPVPNVPVTFNLPTTGAGASFAGAGSATVLTNAEGIATAPSLTANYTSGGYQVDATAGGLSGSTAVFDMTNAAISTATIIPWSGNEQNAVVGSSFGSALEVSVNSASGVPVPFASVTFAEANGPSGAGATFSNSTTVTANAEGMAVAPALTANDVAGNFTVTASSGGVSTTFDLANDPGSPASIAIVGGTPQSATVGAAFGTSLQALVTDHFGNPVPNVPVTFSAPSSGPTGTFGGDATVLTNAQGIATAPVLTANDVGGSFAVTADSGGLSTSFRLVNAIPGVLFDPDGTAQDYFGRSVAMFGGDVLVGAYGVNSGEGAAYLYNSSGQLLDTFTDPNASFNGGFGVAVALSGSFALIGSAQSGPSLGSAYLFNISTGLLAETYTDPSGATLVGFGHAVALSGNNVLVGAYAENGGGAAYLFGTDSPNVVEKYTDPSASPGDFGLSAALSGNDVLVGASGDNAGKGSAYLFGATSTTPLHTFTETNPTAGDEFGAAVALSGSNVLVGGPGANAHSGAAYLYNGASYQLLQMYTDPGAAAGDGFGGSVALSGSNALVGADGVNGLQGAAYLFTLSSQTPQTFADPDATANDVFGISLAISGSNIVVGAYGASAFQGTAYTYAIPAYISAQFGNNQSATVGTAFSTLLEVSVSDAQDNPMSGEPVTFTVTDGSNGAGAAFTGGAASATISTNTVGQALAPALTANGLAGSFTVTASCGGLSTVFQLTNTSGESNPAGVPASISAIGGSSQNTPIGTAFGNLLQALVTDSNGNPVASVPVTFSAPQSGPTGTFNVVATAATNVLGIVTAPALVANHQTGSFDVTATVSGYPSLQTTFVLTNTLVPASIRVKAGSGQTGTVAANYAAPLEALVVNAAGAPVSGVSVDFETPGGGASGAFAGGASAVTNASGIATAPALTANDVAGAFTVEAFVAGVAAPASFTLTNVSGPAQAISISAGSPQSQTVAKAYATALKAEVVDQYGNPVKGAVVTFTVVPQSGSKATFPGSKLTITSTTAATGIATAPTLTANTVAGSFTVTATVNGVNTPATFELTNNPDPPYLAPKGSSESGVVGQAYGEALQALVTDKFGNPIAGLAVTFTSPATGASGTFAGQRSIVAVTNAEGVAIAPAFTANTRAGRFDVTLTAHGAPTGKIALINLPGTAAQLKVVGASARTATPNGALSNLEVEAVDQYGNVIAGEPVTFAIQSNPTSGSNGAFAGQASAPATTDANGIAVARTLRVNAERGTFEVMAAVGDLEATFEVTIE